MTDEHGIFISFEGTEGSGKTTQIRRLAQRLDAKNYQMLVTREPGGTQIGEAIREIIKDPIKSQNMYPEAELLLFAASRAQLVREVIVPALKEKCFVLCDRFLDSTTIYQGVARDIGTERVAMINDFAVNGVLPDLTIVLDVPAEIGFDRIKSRNEGPPDRMEMEPLEFYKNVRKGFLNLAQSLPDRFFVVDGIQNADTIEEIIWNEINKRFDRYPD